MFGFGVGIQRLGSFGVDTLAALNALAAPASGLRPTGFVYADPDTSKNGVYTWTGSAWVRDRGLPEQIATLTVTGGTPNAIVATAQAGVDLSQIVLCLLTPTAANTGAVTLNGKAVKDADGNDLTAGSIVAGKTYLLADRGAQYRVIITEFAAITDIAGLAEALSLLNVDFYDEAALAAASIPAPILSVNVGAGAKRHGRIRISAPSPVKPWHIQSADGAWWTIARGQRVTLEMFGAPANGVDDDLPAWNNALEFLGADGGELHLVGKNYRVSTTPKVQYPVEIVGFSRETIFVIKNSNTEEGLLILHSDVKVHGFTIAADAATAITNGSGHCGTCITVSRWFTPPAEAEPALVKNVEIYNMTLTRVAGSQPAHAIAVMARSSHVTIHKIRFEGAGPNNATGSHGNALLCHWGAHSHGVSTGALRFTGRSGTIVAGRTVTGGTSGATAYIVDADVSGTTGIVYLKEVRGTIVNGETLSDGQGTTFVAQGIVFVTALDFDAQTANFTTGQKVTGSTSGANANIAGQIDNGTTGTLFLTSVQGTFVDNETITDSGGSALVNGKTYSGLRQSRFEPGHYSFHPNNVRMYDFECINVGRVCAASASYNIDISDFSYVGPVQGGQLFDLPIGDEGATFAHPDDYGRVYDGYTMRNGRVRMMTGTGANAVTVFDCSGFSTSKQSDAALAAYASAPYTTEPYAGRAHKRTRQFQWKNVVIDGITYDAGPANPPSTTPYVRTMYFRNLWGNFTFRNIHAIGRDHVLAVELANCNGLYTFEDCDLLGGVKGDAATGLKLDHCRIQNDQYTSGAGAAVLLDGETRNVTTSGIAAKNATSLSIPAGLAVRFNKGDKLSYSGGVVYVDEYGEAGDTTLTVTPLPAASTNNEVFVLDHLSDAVIEDCEIVGGNIGIDYSNTRLALRGGRVSGAGQYGLLGRAGSRSALSVKGTKFSDNGKRRAFVPADSALATRDLIVSFGTVSIDEAYFEDSKYASHNIVVGADVAAGSIRNCVFAGAPITDFMSLATLSNSNRLSVNGNRTTAGASVSDAGASGSNANGFFQYNEDGSLECWLRNVVTDASGNYTWTFPAVPFSQGSTIVLVTPTSVANEFSAQALNSTTTTATIKTWNAAGAAAACAISLYMKGFWR